MLATLPAELLCYIYSFIPYTTLNQVSYTCRSLYISALPSLYSTLVLSFRSHIRQLDTGLQNQQGLLYQVVRQHTKTLVLKCRQGGQHRLIFDITSLLKPLAGVHTLTLTDFHMLPVRAMYSLVGLLPQLHQLSLRYCDLVHTTTHYLPPSSSVTRLECYWTNIPKAAVAPFLSGLPLLTQAKLLANHNRHVMANNHLLAVLPRTCPAIDDLEVGLQEIGDDTVVGCLQRYGSQLQRLSLRSSSVTILHAIQLYTPWVQDLTLRLNTREEEDDGHMLVSVLSHCHRLERVQVDALPPILRQALGQDENKRYHGTKLETMIKDRLEKTFVLDHDQLTGIRSLAPL